MNIYTASEANTKILTAITTLLPQLSSNCPIPTKNDLQEIINSENTILFIAEDSEIIGMLTLVINRIPTGQKAWIEDVVVNQNNRGKGIGQKLIEHAINYAKNNGITKVNLTSSPERIEANKLYLKMGFQVRTTNVYLKEIKPLKI